MNHITRREAMKTLVAGSAGLSLSGVLGIGSANAQDRPNPAPAFRGTRQPKPLPFDPAKLKGLSEKLIRSHHENNYTGAVTALNAVEKRLDMLMRDKDIPPFVYGPLKREELHRTGSVVLHDHYFANLGGDGKPAGAVLDAIKLAFGSAESWEAEFRRTGASLAGGSGWTMLSYNLHTGELHNYWAWDHMHNAPTGLPILVLDMYEHAYHMDYGAAAARYIDAFMQNVQWEEVNRRYVAAQRAAAVLRG